MRPLTFLADTSGRRRRTLLAVVSATGVGLGSCALAFQQPTVRVADVRVGSMSLEGGSVIVQIEVDNPNRYALEAEDFQYALAYRRNEVADTVWVPLARSAIPSPVRIPAQDTGSVRLEVPFELSVLSAAMEQLFQRGALDYRFTGELRVGTPLGSRRIPIDEIGVFRLTP